MSECPAQWYHYVNLLFLIRHNDVIISFSLRFVKDMFRQGASE
ncbi:Uncharacterized protein dnm_038930 [Desulfonema magnum]|uniref:Uncharacterized protein n=1 Tax=Desulfonema magnum TaxID=45655 RepID=A0A975GNJ8_9BACT|nr:Uncharacterized protein dnm_038930 [Desulfonema magnum]